MQLPLDQITAVPKQLAYPEVVGPLNGRLALGESGLRAADDLAVRITYYRAGLDVVVEGTVAGRIAATCGRCLDEYEFPVEVPFRVVLVPGVEADPRGGELDADDLGLWYFEGDAIDVTAIVHEQLLLAVPSARVCSPSCRGLCVRCGSDLNEAPCGCDAATAPPRLAVLHDLLRARITHD